MLTQDQSGASSEQVLGGEGHGGALGEAVWRIRVELKKTRVSTPDSSCLLTAHHQSLPHFELEQYSGHSYSKAWNEPFLVRCLSLAHLHAAVTVAVSRPKPERLSGIGAVLSATLCLEGKRVTA